MHPAWWTTWPASWRRSSAEVVKRLIISAPFGNYLQPEGTTPTLGTFTLARRPGRIQRIIRTVRWYPRIGAWVNRIGLRNPGIDWLAARAEAGEPPDAGHVLEQRVEPAGRREHPGAPDAVERARAADHLRVCGRAPRRARLRLGHDLPLADHLGLDRREGLLDVALEPLAPLREARVGVRVRHHAGQVRHARDEQAASREPAGKPVPSAHTSR